MSTTTHARPAVRTFFATARPTRPNPQMITSFSSSSMVRLLFRSASAPPTTPGDQLDHRSGDVEEDNHSREQEQHREEHPFQRSAAGVEPGERRRDDSAIERGDPAFAHDRVDTDRADEQHGANAA